MHTTVIEVEGVEWRVHHNGDYSGEVAVVGPSEAMGITLYHFDHKASARVPFAVIERLVAENVRQKLIELIEQNDALFERGEGLTVNQAEQMSVEELLY
jgi:hypothetical protein